MNQPIQRLLLVLIVIASDGALAEGKNDPLVSYLLIDRLEAQFADDDSQQVLEGEYQLGYDLNKLVVKVDSERRNGASEELALQALYQRAVSAFWNLRAGLRHDFQSESETEPEQSWAVLELEGLAPYFVETEVSLFVDDQGQAQLALHLEKELLLTQRLILSPNLELKAQLKDDKREGTESGLGEIETGLQLRYEVRREFAPYIGIRRQLILGDSADVASQRGDATDDTLVVIGLRFWL